MDDVQKEPAPQPDPAQSPPASTWPPAVNAESSSVLNDSGQHAGVPAEIVGRWNWGAFFLYWLWCLNHGLVPQGIGILVAGFLLRMVHVPGLSLIFVLAVAIYLGANGNKLGWQNRRFEGGLPEFIEVQKAWAKWGIIVLVVSFGLGILLGILAAIGAMVLPGMH